MKITSKGYVVKTTKDIMEGRKIVAKILTEHRQKKEWEDFFMLIDGHERQEAFLDVYEEMSPQDYWVSLGDIIQGESFYNDKLKELLTNKSKNLSLRHLMMNDADKAIFNKLPDTFSIYRGADESMPHQGWSWSLSEKVALSFAKRFYKSIVIKGECAKTDVIAYFHERKEQEILIPYDKVKNIVILKRIENEQIRATDSIFIKSNLDQDGIPSNYAFYKFHYIKSTGSK